MHMQGHFWGTNKGQDTAPKSGSKFLVKYRENWDGIKGKIDGRFRSNIVSNLWLNNKILGHI